MLLVSSGYETERQAPLVALVPGAKCPGGQVTVAGRFADSTALFWILTRPAGWGQDAPPEAVVQFCAVWGEGTLARGAPMVVASGPAEAVVVLETTVLLTMSRYRASRAEIPAPSQPATLSATMLFWKTTWCQPGLLKPGLGPVGKATPPPEPLSAELPMMRLALMSMPGPMPSLGPTLPAGGTQSWSVWVPQVGSTSGVPMTIIPPPLAGMVGLVLWLNKIALCSMSAFLL